MFTLGILLFVAAGLNTLGTLALSGKAKGAEACVSLVVSVFIIVVQVLAAMKLTGL